MGNDSYNYIISDENAGKRIDKYISEIHDEVSRT